MKITLVKENLRAEPRNFKAAIKSLRDKLGRRRGGNVSQEEMATWIGAKFASYRQWESGRAIPGGKWLIRILQLCPDEEARAAFGLMPVGAVADKQDELVSDLRDHSQPVETLPDGRTKPKFKSVKVASRPTER